MQYIAATLKAYEELARSAETEGGSDVPVVLTAPDSQPQRWQDVKELVRSAGDALSIGFLGSLGSFLTYLQALMHFCETFARDEEATKAMLVRLLS